MKALPLLGLVTAAFFCIPIHSEAADAVDAALAKRLEGTYKIESGESHGKPLPRDRIKDTVVSITRDTIVAVDASKKESYGCTYKLESDKSPSVIHMISTLEGSRGTLAKGLISIEKDSVKLIYKLPTGDVVPTNFQTREGQMLIVLKRQPE